MQTDVVRRRISVRVGLQRSGHRVPDLGWTEFHSGIVRGRHHNGNSLRSLQPVNTCPMVPVGSHCPFFIGRVVVYVVGITVFSTSTVLMGAAEQVWQLMVLRFILAIG